MRFIFGVGTKLFIWETSVSKVRMHVSGDTAEGEEDNDTFEAAPPQDPHSTLNSHLEISPQAIMDGASARRFGFGSEIRN